MLQFLKIVLVGASMLALPVCFVGCAAISIPAAAVNIGSLAYRALDSANISIAMGKEAGREELAGITRIAVWMGKESVVRPYGRIGDLGAVVADNLVLELMSRGYSVAGYDRIPSGTNDSDYGILLTAAREQDIQALITGSVTASQVGSLGIFGSTRTSTVVQSLSLRVTETVEGRTLMILTIDYRTGQLPQIAAEGAAIILEAKLNDPESDIRELIGIRGNVQAKKKSEEEPDI